jgi:ABC-type branched-subunit amino acid transport system ATPase component
VYELVEDHRGDTFRAVYVVQVADAVHVLHAVQEVFNVIKTLQGRGVTILLVEQNAYAALAIADRGYVLETGCVTLTGTGQELISNEEVRAAYLGM